MSEQYPVAPPSTVAAQQESGIMGWIKRNPWLTAIIVLVVIGLLYYFFVHRKKKASGYSRPGSGVDIQTGRACP